MRTDRWLVVAMAMSCVIAGVVEPFVPHAGAPMNAVGVAHTLVLAVLLFAWCKAHANANGIYPPARAPILVAVISFVGLPYYFIRGFGWRRGLKLCLLAIGVLFGLALSYGLSFMISQTIFA
jgi:hypothetical protein